MASKDDMGASRQTVLVIDDTPANLELLLDTLRGSDYELLVAESGAIALEMIPNIIPDIILLDVMMPGMDGYETCAAIKVSKQWAQIPVIFMTALCDTEDKIKAFEAGAVDYITKPIYTSEVLARVTAHLKIHHLQQQLADELSMRVEAENLISQSLDLGVLLLDSENQIIFSTRPTDALLNKYATDFDGANCPSDLLSSDSPLEVRRFSEAGNEDISMFIVQERNSPPGPSALLPLGLTAREAEVLYCIAQGKSNPDISIILTTSVRTIHKQVENIFRKLGLKTRTAAALTALDVLQPRA